MSTQPTKTLKKAIHVPQSDEAGAAKRYTKELVTRLSLVKTNSVILWGAINVLIAIANILILGFAAKALQLLVDNNRAELLAGDIFVVSAVAVASFTFLSFFITIALSVYSGLMKARIYKAASERIQNEVHRHAQKAEGYTGVDADAHLAASVDDIIKQAMSVEKKVSFKTIMLKIITGGAYDK